MQVYIVMGVAGVGKTTIGKLLAKRLQIPFFDADDFHSAENVAKMEKGQALSDEDRAEWLKLLATEIQVWYRDKGAVLACSSLREEYRKQLSSIPEEDLTWVYLHSEYEVIYERLKARKGHYFNPELLRSQYEILEAPTTGIHVNVEAPVEEVIQKIMEKISGTKGSKIGLIGLGIMGKSLALNFASREISISVYNRHVTGKEEDVAKIFAEEHQEEYYFPAFDDLQTFLDSLERPRNIFLMVNAGKAVDAVIENLLPHLEKEDLIIDGGNSHYKDSLRREKHLKEQGVFFLGVGISGGEEGARRGPSIMPGGSPEAYSRVGDLLEKIAAKDKNQKPCCTYVGPDGAGHFVKMVHNGIEYGEMQLIAENYHFLRFFGNYSPEEIASVFEEWNREMMSYLLEISIQILRKKEGEALLLDKILDAAKQKGTGGWSTNAALELGVPLDTITAAVMARNISGRKEERQRAEALYRNKKGSSAGKNVDLEELFRTYKTSVIINHAIGFDLMAQASEEYEWNLDLSEIARIWTNGCIIRSGLMEKIADLQKGDSEHLLLHLEIVSKISKTRGSLLNTLSFSLNLGCPMPVTSAAANYLMSFTASQSSANMIQAQRDYFGAHTYERTDRLRGEFFHSQWEEE